MQRHGLLMGLGMEGRSRVWSPGWHLLKPAEPPQAGLCLGHTLDHSPQESWPRTPSQSCPEANFPEAVQLMSSASQGFSKALVRFFSFKPLKQEGLITFPFAQAIVMFSSPRSESWPLSSCKLSQETQVSFPALLRWVGAALNESKEVF